VAKVPPRRKWIFSAELGVAKPRNSPGIPAVCHLDLTKNLPLSFAVDFHHGLLDIAKGILHTNTPVALPVIQIFRVEDPSLKDFGRRDDRAIPVGDSMPDRDFGR